MASREIGQLVPEMQPMTYEFFAKAKEIMQPWIPFFTATYRSFTEQNQLYAQGRGKPGRIVTNAKGGESLHNVKRAFDLAFKDKNGKVSWDKNLYIKLGKTLINPLFVWGGNWIFRDYPHWEYRWCGKHSVHHPRATYFNEQGNCKI